jgi:hypothetical protein
VPQKAILVVHINDAKPLCIPICHPQHSRIKACKSFLKTTDKFAILMLLSPPKCQHQAG